MDVERVCERVRGAAAAFSGLDVTSLDAAGVRRVLGELRTVRSGTAQLEVALTARARELHAAGAGEHPVDLLTGVGSMPQRRAQQVIRHAELLRRMPTLSAALRAGKVTDDHVDVLASARRRLDPGLRGELDGLDAELTRAASRRTPDELALHLRFVVRRLEAAESRDLDLRRRRACRLSKHVDSASGMYKLSGTFDPETGARIFSAIDITADSLRQHPRGLLRGDDPNDPLATEPEFLAAHALARLVTHGHAAAHPGVPEVIVLVDQDTMEHGDHEATVAEYHDGTPANVDTIARLCCEAILTTVIVSSNGTVPLAVGRSRRTATREQRRALRAVHRTCAIDGCQTLFDWCQIHHIHDWNNGGLTDLDNLAPLCHRHHHQVHEGGWALRLNATDRTLTLMRPDGATYRTMRPPGLRPDAA
jgi:hypothetical protein